MPSDGAERMRDEEKAEEVRPEPPRPLMRPIPPADPFPVDALGDVLGVAAHAIHDRVKAPLLSAPRLSSRQPHWRHRLMLTLSCRLNAVGAPAR
ncbi:MAG TPA: hypothetical protein VHG31_06575, partial [Stellaceae bacterium]|nr:hypothetical protein [Stellaceae bacterium]